MACYYQYYLIYWDLIMNFLKRKPNAPIAAPHASEMQLKVPVMVIMILIVIVKTVDINYIKISIDGMDIIHCRWTFPDWSPFSNRFLH